MKSRFGFTELESREEPIEIPEYCVQLNYLASPSKRSSELESLHLEEIMSPTSPDKWAADVMTVKPRSFSEIVLVIPKETD